MAIINTVQLMNEVLSLVDRDGSARFSDSKIIKSLNTAIDRIVEDRLDNIKVKKNYSFESVQTVRDQLFTLIPPTLNIIPVGNIVAYPSDYNYYLKMMCTIDGDSVVARPTTYNQQGVAYENPFSKPTDVKPYFDQNVDGFVVYRDIDNTGSFTLAQLDYIKNPDVLSIGNESNKMITGAFLVLNVQYIVYEEAVYNGVTYVEGDIITGLGTVNLTSGIIIPNSLIVNCNLPVKLQYEIIAIAASILQKSISQFNEGQMLEKDA